MDIQHLRYLTVIERTGSITGAAKELYMNQPNLSRAVKEVEQETGFPVFRRTAHGVIPTAKGVLFLNYAKKILSQMREMESLYKEPEQTALELDLSVPPGPVFAAAVGDFLAQMPPQMPLSVHCRETTSLEAIANVADGVSRFAVIRYNRIYQDYYENALKNAQLAGELLWEFPMCLVMGEEHPLALCGEVPYHLLDGFTEVVYGDLSLPALSFQKISFDESMKEQRRRIHVYDGMAQYHFLHRVPGAYLWDAPMPFVMAAQYGLVQKECPVADGLCCDVLISRQNHPLSQEESRLEAILRQYAPAFFSGVPDMPAGQPKTEKKAGAHSRSTK